MLRIKFNNYETFVDIAHIRQFKFYTNTFHLEFRLDNGDTVMTDKISYAEAKHMRDIILHYFEDKINNHQIQQQLLEKIQELIDILKYAPPSQLLPNGGVEYQTGKTDFGLMQSTKPTD